METLRVALEGEESILVIFRVNDNDIGGLIVGSVYAIPRPIIDHCVHAINTQQTKSKLLDFFVGDT